MSAITGEQIPAFLNRFIQIEAWYTSGTAGSFIAGLSEYDGRSVILLDQSGGYYTYDSFVPFGMKNNSGYAFVPIAVGFDLAKGVLGDGAVCLSSFIVIGL
jgi:hypothetical protein